MKQLGNLFIILAVVAFSCSRQSEETSQNNAPTSSPDPIEVSIPECYELSNIILALTPYGLDDPQEVHKGTAYYTEMLKYFEPFKNHPLLKKVNYSRELWEDLLSFRTDACAFSFNAEGEIKRDFEFYCVEGHKPFDDNITLINDFAKVSKFREFYKSHKPFYDTIIANYGSYYMISEMKQFLDSTIGVNVTLNNQNKYKIILSPFVGRMNCHRDIDSITTADFPNVADALMELKTTEVFNEEERAIEIHTIFTEMDHGYVNPLSDQYSDEIERNFDPNKWDTGSGYEGINCWNEYVTWALYDLFADKYFPKYSEYINIEWHYQNSMRGFFASNLFATKMKQIFAEKGKGTKLATVYQNIFDWCRETQKTMAYPVIISTNEDSTYQYKPKQKIVVKFSTIMKKNFERISCYVQRTENDEVYKEFYDLTKEDVEWKGEAMILKNFDIKYPKFSIRFNWWGCRFPVVSEQGVILAAESVIHFKK